MSGKQYKLVNDKYGDWEGTCTVDEFEDACNELEWDVDLFLWSTGDGYEIWANRYDAPNYEAVLIEVNEKSFKDRVV